MSASSSSSAPAPQQEAPTIESLTHEQLINLTKRLIRENNELHEQANGIAEIIIGSRLVANNLQRALAPYLQANGEVDASKTASLEFMIANKMFSQSLQSLLTPKKN